MPEPPVMTEKAKSSQEEVDNFVRWLENEKNHEEFKWKIKQYRKASRFNRDKEETIPSINVSQSGSTPSHQESARLTRPAASLYQGSLETTPRTSKEEHRSSLPIFEILLRKGISKPGSVQAVTPSTSATSNRSSPTVPAFHLRAGMSRETVTAMSDGIQMPAAVGSCVVRKVECYKVSI